MHTSLCSSAAIVPVKAVPVGYFHRVTWRKKHLLRNQICVQVEALSHSSCLSRLLKLGDGELEVVICRLCYSGPLKVPVRVKRARHSHTLIVQSV